MVSRKKSYFMAGSFYLQAAIWLQNRGIWELDSKNITRVTLMCQTNQTSQLGPSVFQPCPALSCSCKGAHDTAFSDLSLCTWARTRLISRNQSISYLIRNIHVLKVKFSGAFHPSEIKGRVWILSGRWIWGFPGTQWVTEEPRRGEVFSNLHKLLGNWNLGRKVFPL